MASLAVRLRNQKVVTAMKINEVVNEGVLDTVKQAAGKAGSWLGHQASMSGMLGKNRQYQAIGTQLNKEREMATGAIKQKYLTDLQNGLSGAQKAGLINTNNPDTIKGYVLKFVNNLIRNYKQDPQFSAQLDNLAGEFANGYQTSGGKLPPAAEKIWAAVDSMRRASTSTEPTKQYQPPGEQVKDWLPEKTSKNVYSFDGKSWSFKPRNQQNASPQPVTQQSTVQRLNALYSSNPPL